MDVLSDLRKYGLISTPPANEAYMPPDEDDQDAQDQGDAAQADADQDQQDQEQDQELTAQEQEDMIQVPAEVKDQVLQLHKLAGEIYGAMIGDEENMKDKYTKFENKNPQAPALTEEVDVGSVINELITTSWGGDNASQGKAVELLKGLAFSDDPKANAFMQKLDAFTSGLDPKEFVESKLSEGTYKVPDEVLSNSWKVIEDVGGGFIRGKILSFELKGNTLLAYVGDKNPSNKIAKIKLSDDPIVKDGFLKIFTSDGIWKLRQSK